MKAPHEPSVRVGVWQLLAGGVVISFSPVFVKLAHVGPTAAGFYRTLFGGAVLLVLVAGARDRLWRGPGPALWACAAGALFASDLSFWHRSIGYVGPGLATILANFQVFFLAAAGMLVFGEVASRRLLASIVLAMAGLFLLVGREWAGLGPAYRVGVGLGLLAAASYAGFVLVLRKAQTLPTRVSPTANLALVSLVTALFMGVEGHLQGEPFAIPDGQTWMVLIAYGAVCQALGWIAISKGIVRVGASRAGLLLLLQPALAFLWDMILFGRPTTPVEILGALVALGAVYLGNTRPGSRAAGRR